MNKMEKDVMKLTLLRNGGATYIREGETCPDNQTIYVDSDPTIFDDPNPKVMVTECGMTLELSDRYEAMPNEFKA